MLMTHLCHNLAAEGLLLLSNCGLNYEGRFGISRVRLFVHEAKRKVRIFSVSCRSAMNFVRESLFCGSHEKFGKCLASRVCHDEFGGRDAGTNGSQPGPERIPNEAGSNDGKTLEQSLG